MIKKECQIIRLKNITKEYDLGEIKIKALDEVSLGVCQGDFISIMGPSGSGKTTLLDIMSTLLRPTNGEIFIEGILTSSMNNEKLASFRGKKIGAIFQNFNLLPKLTALENVMVPMWVNETTKKGRKQKAIELLELVGLGDRLNNNPNQLSGGQMQRVAIARALVMNPNIIVADEPTGNLDSKSEKIVINILKKLNKEQGKTILLVTHEESIGNLAKKRIKMKDGKIEKYYGFKDCKKWERESCES